MTAVQNQTTLDTVAHAAEIVELLQQHGDRLGPIWDFSTDGAIHLDTSPATDRASAAAYITWLYLLDTPRIRAASIDKDALVTVIGRIGDQEYRAYGRLHGANAVYLLGLAEPSVHALRRIQIGDVPEVVAA